MLIGNTSLVRKNYFYSNIKQNENIRILRRLQMDSFGEDVARSQMFTLDVIKGQNLHAER